MRWYIIKIIDRHSFNFLFVSIRQIKKIVAYIDIFLVPLKNIHFALHVVPLIFNLYQTIAHSTVVIELLILAQKIVVTDFLHAQIDLEVDVIYRWIFQKAVFILSLASLRLHRFLNWPCLVCYLSERCTLFQRSALTDWRNLRLITFILFCIYFNWFFRRYCWIDWLVFYVIILLDVWIKTIFNFILRASW